MRKWEETKPVDWKLKPIHRYPSVSSGNKTSTLALTFPRFALYGSSFLTSRPCRWSKLPANSKTPQTVPIPLLPPPDLALCGHPLKLLLCWEDCLYVFPTATSTPSSPHRCLLSSPTKLNSKLPFLQAPSPSSFIKHCSSLALPQGQ